MTSIAFWVVVRTWGNERVAKFPYREKAAAESELGRRGEGHYLQMVKISLEEMPSRVESVTVEQRRVRGVSESKDGEKRAWSKVFNDVTVTMVTETGHRIRSCFTTHTHRSEVRVVGFKSMEEWQEMARAKWPEDWDKIAIRMYG